MTFTEFEHHVLPRIILPLMAGLLVAVAVFSPAQAASQTFVIPAGEGYGISECITNGKACGRVVADAWCESHGHAASLAYGPADDVTASIPNGLAKDAKPQPCLLYTSRCV